MRRNISSQDYVMKNLGDIKYIAKDMFDFYRGFKDMEAKGFTESSKKWLTLKYQGDDLSNIETQKYSLADLWKNH